MSAGSKAQYKKHLLKLRCSKSKYYAVFLFQQHPAITTLPGYVTIIAERVLLDITVKQLTVPDNRHIVLSFNTADRGLFTHSRSVELHWIDMALNWKLRIRISNFPEIVSEESHVRRLYRYE